MQARVYSQLAVRSSASPFSKAAASCQPSWHWGRPVCINVGRGTVSAAAVLVEGPVVSVDSCSSRAQLMEVVVVVVL